MPSIALKVEKTSDPDDLALEAQRIVADTLGRLMEFWGFKRHMGRVWGVLYMNAEPMHTAQIAEVLGLSGSATSLALTDLLGWGAVRKTWLRGERRDYFAAETSIWKLIRRVFERRELTLIQESIESFAQAGALLKAAREAASPNRRRELSEVQRKLARLQSIAHVGDRLVRSLVAGKPLNPLELLRAENS